MSEIQIHQSFVKDIAPDLHDEDGQNQIIDHYNRQGWELVSVSGRFAYFKRINPEWVAYQADLERRRLAKRAR